MALGIALFVGMVGVAVWLLRRQRRLLTGAGLAGPAWLAPRSPQIHISGPVSVYLPGGLSEREPAVVATQPVVAPSTALLGNPLSSATSRSTTMRSMTLSTTASNRVFTATKDTGWRVQLRVIGPPGTFGVFTINSPLGAGTLPAEALQVPAGGFNEITLAPGDTLFGLGTIASTAITFSASPTPSYG